MTHDPSAGLPTLRVEVYRLPAGAELLEAGDRLVQRQVGDRIELAHVRLLAAGETIHTRFRYRP